MNICYLRGKCTENVCERERERDSDYEKEARKLHSRKPHLLNRHHFPAKIPLQRL